MKLLNTQTSMILNRKVIKTMDNYNCLNARFSRIPTISSLKRAIQTYYKFEALLAENECSIDDFIKESKLISFNEFIDWQNGLVLPSEKLLTDIGKYFCMGNYFNKMTHTTICETKQTIYDEMCHIIADYENPAFKDTTAENLYRMLVKIQNHWETITTEIDSDIVKTAIDKQTPKECHTSCYNPHKYICPNCLQVEDESANYCRACGQALSFKKDDPMSSPEYHSSQY